MTKSIQQVKQDLENLKSIVSDTAIELEKLHLNYLDLLSQSLKQQLILACYQICTRLYPQSFLELSLSEKQDLQQNLRQISIQLEPKLTEILKQKELEPEPLELNLMAEFIKNLPKTKRRKEDQKESETEIDLERVKAELENIEFIEIDASDNDDDEQFAVETPPREKADFQNPEHLILWHKQIERGIKKTLDVTSRKVNKCLQDARIISDSIPSKVIDVAMQADSSKGLGSNSQSPAVPHVIQLSIEIEKDKKANIFKKPVQVSLVRLRLTELEFSDHQLNAKKGQIRNLMGKIQKLNSQYKAIKQEVAMIEAQAAWRSSWYED